MEMRGVSRAAGNFSVASSWEAKPPTISSVSSLQLLIRWPLRFGASCFFFKIYFPGPYGGCPFEHMPVWPWITKLPRFSWATFLRGEFGGGGWWKVVLQLHRLTRFFPCTAALFVFTKACHLCICGFKPNRLGVSSTHDASEIIKTDHFYEGPPT